jgi:hypothetical protein
MVEVDYPEFQDLDEAERTLLATAARTLYGGEVTQDEMFAWIAKMQPWLAPATLRTVFDNLVADGRLVARKSGLYRPPEA